MSDPDAPYINGNPATGTQGSIPPAASIEYDQREIVNFISDSAFTPDNADLRQLSRSVQNGRVTYAADSGTLNAMAVTLTPVPLAYYTGMRIFIKFNNTNTGAATLNVNALGIKDVKRANGAVLLSGDLIKDAIGCLVYDGTRFLVISHNGSTLYRGTRVTYTTPGATTFTALVAGPHKLTIWGGGGGGGYGHTGAPGSAGTAGTFGEVTRTLTVGQVVNLVVGAPGAAGSNGVNGGAGVASSAVIGAETFTAGGGPGGISNSTSGTSTNSPVLGTATGAWDRSVLGQQGGPGYVMTNPGAAGGYGGSATMGGQGGVGGGGSAGPGTAPGGGGGASANANAAAAGARGEIWVEY